MKRRRRSRSRKSCGPAAPATSSRSGEPTYPHRSGETAASSDRYGERASYASAAAPERMQHQRSEGGSPSPGEETTVRPKRRKKKIRPDGPCVWIPKRLLRRFNGKVQAALKAYTEEDGNAPVVIWVEPGVPWWPHGPSTTTSSSSSSWSGGDAQEEAPFDREETSLLLEMDQKPKPTCSGDCGKIAQDDEGEDVQSDEKPCSAVEDEQHSGKVGVHAIEEQKQEQGSARGDVQALLDMDDETISNKIWCFYKRLNYQSPEHGDYHPEYERDEVIELYEQLALFRIRAYELKVDTKLAKPDDPNLKLQYPPSKLYGNNFFRYLEERLGWYFDLERCKNARFDNYQRLVLHGHHEYLDWDFYQSVLNTYEEDQEYVHYFEAVSNKTKWVEDYLGGSMIQWEKIRSVVFMQALEIAESFPHVSPLLVTYGFDEYIFSIQCDFSYKGLDGLYFEIWKRVAKGKMSLKEALLEIHKKGMFPFRSSEIIHALENVRNRTPIKDYYDAHLAGIDKMASDDEVHQLIRDSIREKMASKPKCYLDYARKKLSIAKDIGLISEGRRGGVAPLDKGDNGKTKVEMDD